MSNKLVYIFFAALLVRLAVIPFINLSTEEYWEYGSIAKNIANDRGYSLFYFNDSRLLTTFDHSFIPEPSAYMLPGYTYFIYSFLSIENIPLRNIFIIFTQSLISAFLVLLIYKYTLKLFGNTVAIIASLITAFNPEFIYSVSSFTPTVLYHLLIIVLLYNLHKYHERREINSLIYITICFAALQLLRSETFLFIIIFFAYLLISRKLLSGMLFIFIIILSMTPWIIRNYIAFNELIPFTTSLGMNLYRGNNPEAIGDWGTREMIQKVELESKIKPLEIAYNDVYTQEAFEFIKYNIPAFFGNTLVKLFELWIFNLHDARAENLLYKTFTIIFFLTFLYGFMSTYNRTGFTFEKLYFLLFSIVISVFFVLPRYQVMLRIMIIPYSAFTLNVLFIKLKSFRTRWKITL